MFGYKEIGGVHIDVSIVMNRFCLNLQNYMCFFDEGLIGYYYLLFMCGLVCNCHDWLGFVLP